MPWLSNAIIGGSACPDASPMKRSPTTIGTPVTWQSDYVKTRLQWPRPSRIRHRRKKSLRRTTKPAIRRQPRCAGGKAQRATYVALSQAAKSKSRYN
jgi:hypothetical protein